MDSLENQTSLNRASEDEITQYFESIRAAFMLSKEAKTSRADTDGSGALIFIPILLLIFSLIPAIPAFITFVINLVFHFQYFILFGVNVPIHAFWLWYAISVLVFAGLIAVGAAVESQSTKHIERKYPKDQLLAPRQYRFALCREIIEQISLYRTNRRSIHIEKAISD